MGLWFSMCLDWAEAASAFQLSHFAFFFFFFFLSAATFDKSSVNSAFVYCSRVPQITLFSNFFIKNGSHSTIYTFKNYFATMFSVSVFSFSKNKLNPNGPLVATLVKFISHKIFLPKLNANWILGFGFLCGLLILWVIPDSVL